MLDAQNRSIDYIRISVTDRCNLRCVYCMPEEGVHSLPHEEILSYEEIRRLCGIFSALGIRKVKLTGGEPLTRKDIAELVRMLKADCGMESVTLTTNGILLTEQLAELVRAGIDGVNISFDTLDQERFREITRRDKLEHVLAGICFALTFPELNVKINCVPVADHVDDALAIAGLAKDQRLNVRFIEMMPIGLGKQSEGIREAELIQRLECAYGKMTPCGQALGNGPAHYYHIQGFQGNIGFISAISHKFCSECNRIRLTADGYLKTCLQYEADVDLKNMLRNGADDEQLLRSIREEVFGKPQGHHFTEKAGETNPEQHYMSQIGG